MYAHIHIFDTYMCISLIHVHIYKCMHIYTYLIHSCLYLWYMYTYTNVCIYTHIWYIYVYIFDTCTHIQIYAYIHINVCIYTHMYRRCIFDTCMFEHTHMTLLHPVHIHIWYITKHTHMYHYIHTCNVMYQIQKCFENIHTCISNICVWYITYTHVM